MILYILLHTQKYFVITYLWHCYIWKHRWLRMLHPYSKLKSWLVEAMWNAMLLNGNKNLFLEQEM